MRRYFVVPARQISRYAAITEGVGVEPRPRAVRGHARSARPRASPPHQSATASRSPQSIVRRCRASYKGPTSTTTRETHMDSRDYPGHLRPVPDSGDSTAPNLEPEAERHSRPDPTDLPGPLQRLRHRRPRRPRLRHRRRTPARRSKRPAPPAAHPSSCSSNRGRSPRPALAGGRRALRLRPHRPHRLPGRHGGREPDLGQHRAPLPGAAGRLRRQADAAGRDGRPDQRARGRRHPDGDRPRLPGRGRRRRRHRGADRPPQHAAERRHRGRRSRTRKRTRTSSPKSATCRSAPRTRR